jgi:inner membrane transporter RhtA
MLRVAFGDVSISEFGPATARGGARARRAIWLVIATLAARTRRLDVPPGVLVILSALSVQVGASVAAGLFARFGPVTIVAIRLIFGAILVGLFRRPRIRGTPARAWRSALMLGVVLAFMNTSFYLAISRIPLGVVVTIEFVGPLAAAILGSRRPLDFVWVILAGVGVVLLTGPRLESGDVAGLLAAGCTGLGWFLFILLGARVSRDWPDGSGVSASMTVSALLILPLALLFGNLEAVAADPAVLIAGLVIALFSSALPYTFDVAALGRLRPETYGILVSLEPAFGTIAGFLLLSQALEVSDVVAIALVTLASMGASLTAPPVRDASGEAGG